MRNQYFFLFGQRATKIDAMFAISDQIKSSSFITFIETPHKTAENRHSHFIQSVLFSKHLAIFSKKEKNWLIGFDFITNRSHYDVNSILPVRHNFFMSPDQVFTVV